MELEAMARACGGFTRRRPIAAILLLVFGSGAVVLAIPFWLFMVIPSLPVCLTVWFLGRKRVRWTKWDFLVVVLPYLSWITLLVLQR
jgi:hypothetical protein